MGQIVFGLVVALLGVAVLVASGPLGRFAHRALAKSKSDLVRSREYWSATARYMGLAWAFLGMAIAVLGAFA